MTTELPIANHHAHHPGFSGPSGLIAALGFLRGRDQTAQLAARLLDLRPGDTLVDIGCGPGVAARLAAGLGASVVGVDPASVMLKVARRSRETRVSWRIGTAEAIPVETGWATAAWSLATVHHWHDIAAGLGEVHRVLAPGGRFVAIERQTRAGATGIASHGWQPAQAQSFARECERLGLIEVRVETHETNRGPELCVIATRSGETIEHP